MKTLKETIQGYLQNEEFKTEIKNTFKPFGAMIYNEIYFYLLLICIYCVLLFLFGLTTIIAMLNLTRQFKRVEHLLEKIHMFNNLDEYITYHDTQKSNGNNCPLLYLVKENNSQGEDVYRIRPSPFDLQGGLSTSDTYVDSPISFLNITIPPSKDDYSGFDPLNLGVGEYTDLDKIHDSTENQPISDNPMDSNWGGREYTRELVDSGKYDDYNIYRPNLSNSKFGRA